MSDESVQHYFDIRDAFNLYDKRISALTDLFHQMQLDVNGSVTKTEQKMEYLKGRIDEGLSPTMQTVKKQNEDLDKSFIRMEGQMVQMVGEVKSDLALVKDQLGNMDKRFQERFKEYDDLKKEVRGFILKVAFAIIVAIAGTFFTVWETVNDLKGQINSIPTAISRQPRKHQ